MTLTFAYIDGRHTIQVADRRISVKGGDGRFSPRHDRAVKIVEPRGSILLSYTGAADIAGDTAQWLLTHLDSVGPEIDAALGEVSGQLSHIFSQPPFDTRSLTVTMTGWGELNDGRIQPMAASITNRDPSTRRRMPEFIARAALIDPLRGGWISTGVALSAEAHNRVDASIQKAAPKLVSAEVIANIFLSAIRRESTPTNGVSANAIGVIYPHAVVDRAHRAGDRAIHIIRTGDGMIMPGSCSEVLISESVPRFVTIDLARWDWSRMRMRSVREP